MVGRIRETIRALPGRLQHAAPHAKAKRIVLSRDDRAKRRGLIRNSSILAKSPPHLLVDHRFQVQLDPSTLCGRHHHEDSKHVVHGVDEIETAAGAIPTVFTEWPVRIRRWRGSHCKTKTEATGGAWKIEGIMNDPGLRPNLIRRHQCDRLTLEVSLAVQLTTIEQHLQEAGVVPYGRNQARSTGLPAPRQRS